MDTMLEMLGEEQSERCTEITKEVVQIGVLEPQTLRIGPNRPLHRLVLSCLATYRARGHHEKTRIYLFTCYLSAFWKQEFTPTAQCRFSAW